MGIDTHVTGSSAQALSFSIGNVLLPGTGKHCQALSVSCELLLTSLGLCIALPYQSQLREWDWRSCYSVVQSKSCRVWYHDRLGFFRGWSVHVRANNWQVRLAEWFCFHNPTWQRPPSMKPWRTICLAVIQHVLTVNFLPHMSNKSSRDGPSKSITRMLCKPSWPK